jgi:hypothetical protein
MPVLAAAHLIETGEARSVEIVVPMRPSYRQLVEARECATRYHLQMTVRGASGLRFERLRDETEVAAATQQVASRAAWLEHLLSMREGVR